MNIYLKGYQGKDFYCNFSAKIKLTHLSVMCMPTLNRNARFITIGLFRFALWVRQERKTKHKKKYLSEEFNISN